MGVMLLLSHLLLLPHRCSAVSIARGGLGLRIFLYSTSLVFIVAVCKHLALP